MQIRSPYASELGDLAQLDGSIYGAQAYSVMTLRQFLDLAGPLLAVGVDESGIVGYSVVLPSFVRGQAWFMALGVRVDRRRAGIGRVLAARALETAAKHDLDVIRLTVAPTNVAAIALYQGLGFVNESVVEEYFEAEDRVILRKTLAVPAGFRPAFA